MMAEDDGRVTLTRDRRLEKVAERLESVFRLPTEADQYHLVGLKDALHDVIDIMREDAQERQIPQPRDTGKPHV